MQILPAESLRPYNSLSLEASAAALALVDTDQELSKALDWSRARGLAVLPLGQGSNVVIVDDLEALVVRQQGTGFKVLDESDHEVSLRVSAGQDWHSLVEKNAGAGPLRSGKSGVDTRHCWSGTDSEYRRLWR